MRVAVGSENPVKVSAVEEVFSEVFGSVEVIPVSVDSGVSPQLFNLDTLRGSEEGLPNRSYLLSGIRISLSALSDRYRKRRGMLFVYMNIHVKSDLRV